MNPKELASYDQAASFVRDGLCEKCLDMDLIPPLDPPRVYKVTWNDTGNVDYMALCTEDADFARENVTDMVTLTLV